MASMNKVFILVPAGGVGRRQAAGASLLHELFTVGSAPALAENIRRGLRAVGRTCLSQDSAGAGWQGRPGRACSWSWGFHFAAQA